MKFNLKRTIKMLVLAILLLGIVMSLGMTSLSKTTLMNDEKLTQLYARVNDATMGKTVNKNLPARTAVIDGVEYSLEYVNSFVYDESVYESKTISQNHLFRGDGKSGVSVIFVGDKNDPNEWESFFKPDDSNIKDNDAVLEIDQRIEIALEYASKYIDTEGYVLTKTSEERIHEYSTSDYLIFSKVVGGFESCDRFTVVIAKTGAVLSFNKQRHGILNEISIPEIDEELFKNTLNEYAKKIHGEFLYLEIDEERTEIMLDKDGNPIIKVATRIIRAATEEEKKQSGNNVRYINANIPVYCDDVKANK